MASRFSGKIIISMLVMLWAAFGNVLACEVSAASNITLRAASAEAFADLKAAQRPIDLEDDSLLTEAIFHETNKRRERQGLGAIEYLSDLNALACMHARAMIKKEFFGHINPYEQGQRTPQDRAQRIGLKPSFIAENIIQVPAIRYHSGEPVYIRQEAGKTLFSRKPKGPPIERHTYLSFAESVLDRWMKSPGHRKNILAKEPRFLGAACENKVNDIGMNEFYCVQLFFSGAR